MTLCYTQDGVENNYIRRPKIYFHNFYERVGVHRPSVLAVLKSSHENFLKLLVNRLVHPCSWPPPFSAVYLLTNKQTTKIQRNNGAAEQGTFEKLALDFVMAVGDYRFTMLNAFSENAPLRRKLAPNFKKGFI